MFIAGLAIVFVAHKTAGALLLLGPASARAKLSPLQRRQFSGSQQRLVPDDRRPDQCLEVAQIVGGRTDPPTSSR
jgi:hypothetical protein